MTTSDAVDTGRNEKLLLKSVSNLFPSHRFLLDFLQDLQFGSSDENRVLHYDLEERVASYLIVPRVNPRSVKVVGCSSTDGSHPLAECLSMNEDTWWISGAESMPGGRGSEYVEFQLSTNWCRLSRIGIKIPPLPHGPLSVRDFVVQAFLNGQWEYISPMWSCDNVSHVQYFAFDESGVDVQRVRVICITNQLHDHYHSRLVSFNFNRVGFYGVTFE